jgi:hypothetical protein
MNKLLLTTAILASLVVPAGADPLPNEFVGSWCKSEAREGLYALMNLGEKCDTVQQINITPKTLKSLEVECTFTTIKTLANTPKGRQARVTANCSHDDSDARKVTIDFSLWRDSFLAVKTK